MPERVRGRNNKLMGKAAHALAVVLEQRRLEAEMTKKAFAAKLGISTPYLHELLNGVGNPTLGTLEEMAEKLNLEYQPFFREKETQAGDQSE